MQDKMTTRDWLLIVKKLMEITIEVCAGTFEVTMTLFDMTLFCMKSESKRCDVCRDGRQAVVGLIRDLYNTFFWVYVSGPS